MLKADWIQRHARLLSSYLVAAVSVGIAMVITLGLGSVIKNTATLFFCSVMLSSWYGGLWPGVFAALLSVVALDYYFILPLYALGISLEEAQDMIVFVATALFIGWLSGEQKRGERIAAPCAR
jgi:K+-sensing histidine kinase KdpD